MLHEWMDVRESFFRANWRKLSLGKSKAKRKEGMYWLTVFVICIDTLAVGERIAVVHWRNDTDREHQQHWEKTLSQCHFVHHKSQMNRATETRPPPCVAEYWDREPRHGRDDLKNKRALMWEKCTLTCIGSSRCANIYNIIWFIPSNTSSVLFSLKSGYMFRHKCHHQA
jgi:hypothetical protein